MNRKLLKKILLFLMRVKIGNSITILIEIFLYEEKIATIDALNKRCQNALIKNVDGEMEDEDFKELKKQPGSG